MLQFHQSGAPAAGIRWRVLESGDKRIAPQETVYSFFQYPAAFAVYQPHREDAGFETFVEVIFQQFRHIPREKRVQIQDIFDR